MKKIIKPAEVEEAAFYSDFTGKVFHFCGPEVTLKLDFNYGSAMDGAYLELHLSDEDIFPILELIKSKLAADSKENLANKLKEREDEFTGALEARDWQACDYLSNSAKLFRDILGVTENCE